MKISLASLGACALSFVGVAYADRSSADYTLIHESTITSHGKRLISADYTVDTSGNPAFAVMVSSDYTLRGGFAGQLIDPASLEVTGAMAVSELGTSDLNADLTYDDDTVESDVMVTWSPVSSPLVSISAGGLVTAGAVYENTAATVQADYQSLSDVGSLTVLDVDPDNFQTYGGDGLPDLWQVSNFGIDNPLAAPGEDADGDRQDNLFEYLTGHTPIDGASRFGVTILDEDTVEVSKVIPDRTYRLWRSQDLINWTLTGLVVEPLAESLDEEFTDPSSPLLGEMYYQVTIEE